MTTTLEHNGYKGNRNIKRAGIKYDFSANPEHLEEFIMCAEDPIYFIKNYCKIVKPGSGLIQFEPYEYQIDVIQAMMNNRFTILKWPRQYGKLLDVTTPILTPKGFVKLDDLIVGDVIYGPDGKETTLTFITEKTFNKKTYKVTFDNGDHLIACSEHLWQIGSNNWKIRQKKSNGKFGRVTGPEKVMTTEEIIPLLNYSQRPYISFTKPLEMSEKKYVIDPYLLGLWLGDGTSKAGLLTCHSDDYNFYSTQFNNSYIVNNRDETLTVRFEELTTDLKSIDVYGNKHIPGAYFIGSYDQRLALVQGLMDTDGTCDKRGYCSFTNKNELIVDGLRTLLSSLGIKSRKRIKIVNTKLVQNATYFEVVFCPNIPVFRLERKLSRQKIPTHLKNNRLYITSIEEVESVPMKCLQVDNDSHLFLAGPTLIPTHNTTTVGAILLWHLLFNKQYTIAVLAHQEKQAREILSRIQTMFEYLPHWLQQGVSEWNKGSVEFENGSNIFIAATSPSAVRGRSIDWIYLDEFAFVPTNMQEEFYTSAWPTISSADSTKMTISSTPNGFNFFWKIWDESEQDKNDFVRNEVHWSDMPGRDEKWKERQIKNSSIEQFKQEYECVDGNTLIELMDIETNEIFMIKIKDLYDFI